MARTSYGDLGVDPNLLPEASFPESGYHGGAAVPSHPTPLMPGVPNPTPTPSAIPSVLGLDKSPGLGLALPAPPAPLPPPTQVPPPVVNPPAQPPPIVNPPAPPVTPQPTTPNPVPRTYDDFSDAELRNLYSRYLAAGYHGGGTEFGGVYFRNWVDQLHVRYPTGSDIELFKTVQDPGNLKTIQAQEYQTGLQRLEQSTAYGGRQAEEELLAGLASRGLLNSGIAARELERFRGEKLKNMQDAALSLNQILLSGADSQLRQEMLTRLQADLQRRNQEALLTLENSINQSNYDRQHQNDLLNLLFSTGGTIAGAALSAPRIPATSTMPGASLSLPVGPQSQPPTPSLYTFPEQQSY